MLAMEIWVFHSQDFTSDQRSLTNTYDTKQRHEKLSVYILTVSFPSDFYFRQAFSHMRASSCLYHTSKAKTIFFHNLDYLSS